MWSRFTTKLFTICYFIIVIIISHIYRKINTEKQCAPETISSFGIEQSVAVTACVRVCVCVYLPQVIIILLLFLLFVNFIQLFLFPQLCLFTCVCFLFQRFSSFQIHTMIIYCVRASERIVLTRAANNSTQLNWAELNVEYDACSSIERVYGSWMPCSTAFAAAAVAAVAVNAAWHCYWWCVHA